MITNKQYQRLNSGYEKTGEIVVSAMKADIHPQTARKYIKAAQPPTQAPRTWRTRPDPLAKIWEEVVEMLRETPELEAKTLFEHLLARPDSGLAESNIRTFYRRVRDWRATEGPQMDAFNAWQHQTGQLLQLDGTYATQLQVTSPGENATPRTHRSSPSADHCWMLRLLQGDIGANDLVAEVGTGIGSADAESLVEKVRKDRLALRNRALAVAADLKGISLSAISRFLFLSKPTVREYLKRFRQEGLPHLFDLRRKDVKKADDPQYKDALFKILHAPPHEYGFNRTTWRMLDLKEVLAIQGVRIAPSNIRQIIRGAGYRVHKAKKVLTSNDPEYRTKLQEITNILRNLKPNEKFFSVDEYGPFAVKIQGGRSLMKPGEIRTVPQYQKSKGSLILTAALELSENQVTHFYSDRKNTDEMLKLLEILLQKYSDQSCIYFSWDAASGHASKKLYKRVEEINSAEYRAEHKVPLVKLAPLPSCAQFLNVIESVFSGMAKAIIHNSDYPSVDACKAAIDRHFKERNRHFRAHPKRAGKKIWGKELVPPEFSESNNCKDPRYRGGPH
ncbi:MAG: IS630 family transposase [Verrucomicrobiota bacterium]